MKKETNDALKSDVSKNLAPIQSSSVTASIEASSKSSLIELATIFLRLGATSFGGPLAHIALMEQEFVSKRAWMTRQEFLDLVGATNLVPGPNSTEVAIHIGKKRGGWPGLFVAGFCFIAPAAAMMLGLAALYARFGAMPQAQQLLRGVAPVVVAIVAQALWKFAQTALLSTHARLVALCAFVFVASGANELVVLALAAALGLARGLATPRKTIVQTMQNSTAQEAQAQEAQAQEAQAAQIASAQKTQARDEETRSDEMRGEAPRYKARGAETRTSASETQPVETTNRSLALRDSKRLGGRREGNTKKFLRRATGSIFGCALVLWPLGVSSLRGLYWSFLKIGSVLYGSGYVLLAFLQSEFVPRFLSQRQLLDAVAIGQITPGPLFTTATFVGFQIAGFWGAMVATIGIFAPSFAFVALLSWLMEKMQSSPIMRAFLDSVNAASLALMVWVSWLLARSATSDGADWKAVFVVSLSLVVLLKTRLNSVWLLCAGALWGAFNVWLHLR